MKKFTGYEKGMGIGGWLTNYKRFNVLPDNRKLVITQGDREHFETYITRSDVENIAKAGFAHIRLGFDQIVLEEQPYVYSKAVFDILHRFVDWCDEFHLNIVFNLHKCIGNYCDIKEDYTIFDSEELQNRFISLWLEIERQFAGHENIAFELLNEVRDVDPRLWNDLAERTVCAIRKENKNRKIIIGSSCWNNANKLKFLRLYDDENIIYTFHFYHPLEFTHQRGVLMADPLYYNRTLTYPCDDVSRYSDYHALMGWANPYANYSRIDKQALADNMSPAFDFIREHPDKILWCGEFGTIRHIDITSRENWMRDVISLLKEHDIPYCVWNYLSTPNDGNRFSLVDVDKREFLSERLLNVLLGK